MSLTFLLPKRPRLVSRSEICSQHTHFDKKEKRPDKFSHIRSEEKRGLGNSCAIKNVWPHKLTLNASPYSFFLISLSPPVQPDFFHSFHLCPLAWLRDRSARTCCQGLRSANCRILMSISCLKQLKMKLLTNREWCRWRDLNYGDRGGAIGAAGLKNQSLATVLRAPRRRLCQHASPKRTTHHWIRCVRTKGKTICLGQVITL